MSDKPNRIEVKQEGLLFVHQTEFFLKIQDKILEGYRIADNKLMIDKSIVGASGSGARAVMYLDGNDPSKVEPEVVEEVVTPEVKPEPVVEEVKVEEKVEEEVVEEEEETLPENTTNLVVELETLTKKDELLAFAEKHEIEVPNKVKQPAAIKKYIANKL